MSFLGTVCDKTDTQAPPSLRPAQPLLPTSSSIANLWRATVTLPRAFRPQDREERWVFFEPPKGDLPQAHIEALLALAWNISTTGWCDCGLIYEVTAACDLIKLGDAEDDTALFECEWGCEGTKHVAPADVDFFCSPRVRARLEQALLQAHVGNGLQGGAA